MEPSVGEAATEPSIAEAESSVAQAAVEAVVAQAAVEASAAEATVEASTGTMETSSPSDAKTRHGWGRTESKGRQGSGKRSEERRMHDSHSNLLVRARRSVREMI